MNFVVDKDNKQIKVEREFHAGRDTVWAAWTESEILDQWWAPRPWKAKTKSMNFAEGGTWIYAMIGPDGETHWSRADFRNVKPKVTFSGVDGFCDENGTINKDLPVALWKNAFSDKGESTMVNIVITYDNLGDLERIIEMGFKEGFTMGMQNLDELLEGQHKSA